jgi:hypothetical protein
MLHRHVMCEAEYPLMPNFRQALSGSSANWVIAGSSDSTRGPRGKHFQCMRPVSVYDADPEYSDLPLQHPIVVEAGTSRSIAVHTDDRAGLVVRREGAEHIESVASDANLEVD